MKFHFLATLSSFWVFMAQAQHNIRAVLPGAFDEEYPSALGIQLALDKEEYNLNAYTNIHLNPNRSVAAVYSYQHSLDSLDTKHNSWELQEAELGYGHTEHYGSFYSQSIAYIGFQRYSYRYYDTALRIQSFGTSSMTASFEFQAGMRHEYWSLSVTNRFKGMYALEGIEAPNQSNTAALHALQSSRTTLSNIIYEPGLMLGLLSSPDTYITLSAQTRFQGNGSANFTYTNTWNCAMGAFISF